LFACSYFPRQAPPWRWARGTRRSTTGSDLQCMGRLKSLLRSYPRGTKPKLPSASHRDDRPREQAGGTVSTAECSSLPPVRNIRLSLLAAEHIIHDRCKSSGASHAHANKPIKHNSSWSPCTTAKHTRHCDAKLPPKRSPSVLERVRCGSAWCRHQTARRGRLARVEVVEQVVGVA
jgi:hypothetical protein